MNRLSEAPLSTKDTSQRVLYASFIALAIFVVILRPVCGQGTAPGGLAALADVSASAPTNAVAPRAAPRQKERDAMVAEQIAARGVTDARVLAAMRKVPRHQFMPDDAQRLAYHDFPVPIGYGQTISQPYIVAYMTEALGVTNRSKVLEIGTGSGYQAAVLAEITPRVWSVEIIPELAKRARTVLDAAGYNTVRTRTGDGYFGWESEGPWDAIVVTAAAEHVPPPLLKQLKPGGRMCIPVGSPFGVQYLLLVEKHPNAPVTTRELIPVRFVPLTRDREGR